jgi:hypothetical protein
MDRLVLLVLLDQLEQRDQPGQDSDNLVHIIVITYFGTQIQMYLMSDSQICISDHLQVSFHRGIVRLLLDFEPEGLVRVLKLLLLDQMRVKPIKLHKQLQLVHLQVEHNRGHKPLQLVH